MLSTKTCEELRWLKANCNLSKHLQRERMMQTFSIFEYKSDALHRPIEIVKELTTRQT